MWGRTGAAAPAAFLLATAFLACQTRANGRTAKPGEGADPPPRFWGSENVEKNPVEIMGASNAHRNLVREMGPECRCAVRNATATRVCAGLRRVGCTTYTCSPPQAATLLEGVRHVMGRAEARGGSLREHRLRKGAPRMRSCRMRSAPFRRCVVQVGRAVHLFGKLLCHKAHAG